MDEAQRSDNDHEAPDNISHLTDHAKERIEPEIDKAREQLQASAERARHQADLGIEKAAGSLDSAAGRIKAMSSEHEGKPARAGTKLAEEMEEAASYLREHDSSEIFKDLSAYVKKHPLQAVVGAIVAGFFVGRVLH